MFVNTHNILAVLTFYRLVIGLTMSIQSFAHDTITDSDQMLQNL